VCETDPELLQEQISFYRGEAAEYDAWLEGMLNGPSSGSAVDAFRDGRRRVATMLARLQPHGRVLEIAAGTASFTPLVASYADELTLLDASPESLALARRRLAAGTRPVRYIQADVFEWDPPDAEYDTVCFAAWLHHVPPSQFEAFWRLVGRVLAPGGQVIFDFADRAVRRPGDGADIPPEPSVEYRVYHRAEQGVSVRDIGGNRWRVVHTLWDADELSARLADLGWNMRLETVGWDVGSQWAKALRAQ